MTQSDRRRGWAALASAQSTIALRASGADDKKKGDTPPAWMILFDTSVCNQFSGGITL
jgi:hypothetical protein